MKTHDRENREDQGKENGSWTGLGCVIIGLMLLSLYILSPPWCLKICLTVSPGSDPGELSQKIEKIYPVHVWLYDNNETFERVWMQYIGRYSF